MATPSRYPQNRNHSSTYYTPHSAPAPMNSTDARQLYGPERDLGLPPLDYPPQVLEIDPSSSTTLPSPSTPVSWNAPGFALPAFGEISTFGPSGSTRQVILETHDRGTAQNPLVQWYNGNDGPWVPKSSISDVPQERHPSTLRDHRVQFAHGNPYRQRIPSDVGPFQFGVPPSDSGYGTRRSDGDASVFSADAPDRDQDGRSFAGHVSDFQLFPGMVDGQSQDANPDDWNAIPDAAMSDEQPGKTLLCQTCRKPVKTRSELKKHDLRHSKPFVCDYPGCSRTEGFSTSNDLDRHRRSKHPSVLRGSAATKRYRCHVQGCKSKDKSWPRLDNFRSHLKRVHRKSFAEDDEFEKMVQQAGYMEPVASNINQDHDFNHSASLRESSQSAMPVQELKPPIMVHNWRGLYPEAMDHSQDLLDLKERQFEDPDRDAPMDELASTYDSPPRETVHPSDILQVPEPLHHGRSALQSTLSTPLSLKETYSRVSDEDPLPAVQTTGLRRPGKPEARHASALDAVTEVIKTALVGGSVPAENNGNARNHSPEWALSSRKSSPEPVCKPALKSIGLAPNINVRAAPSPSESSVDAEAQRKAVEILKTLHHFGYIVQKDPSHSIKPFNPGSVASSRSEKLVTCSTCGKFKGRPCELKKHMKRHSRPYACTFPACNNKTFGSKNDWKRHENSQHFHLESWRCDVAKPEGGVCAKVCYRKQTFTDHLQKDHLISDGDAVSMKTQACHIGRNCQSRFWCGFCVKLIDLKKKSVEAWAERFDHIDDHFMGRNDFAQQSIQDWVPVDSSDQLKPDSLALRDFVPSPKHESPEDSAQSPDSRSSNGSSPEPTGLPESSSGDAGDAATQRKGKRKHDDDDDDDRPGKRRETSNDALVYCCQCQTSHNPKLDQNCTVCNDSHRFCDSCVVEIRSSPKP